jgi:Protein of unknown function (DUF3618)
MSQPSSGTGRAAPASGRSSDPEAIKAEIEATREQLGRTVDELAARLDLPSRAKERFLRSRDIVVETYRESPPAVLGAAGVLVGVIAGIVVWRRNR